MNDAAARAEKARAKYRRIYRMRLARAQALRERVAALEQELAALFLRAAPASTTSESPPPPPPLLGSSADGAPSREEQERAVLALSAAKLQLRRENAELRARLRASAAGADRVWAALLAEQRAWVADAGRVTALAPLTAAQAAALQARAAATLARVVTERAALTPAGVVGGWAEARGVRGGLVRFELRKTFHRRAAANVAARLFSLLADPRQIAKLYAARMDVSFRLAQRVSDDCVVLLMEMASLPGVRGRVTSAPIISRRRVGASSFQVLVQPLVANGFPLVDGAPMDRAAARGLNAHCFGMLLEPEGPAGEDCRARFVGVAQAVEAASLFWLVEELQHCIRAEELMFGPRFSLPPSAHEEVEMESTERR